MRISAGISYEVNLRKSCLSVLLFFSALFVVSCSSTPHYEAGRPVSGPLYWTASYYADKFHGRPTASGEIFNMHAMTAAHKTMSFGTRLRVTNMHNGRSVVVTINDRGPFVRGRQLDLSYGAARRIGMIASGTARVKVQVLGRDTSYVKKVSYSASEGPFTLQIGSFRDKNNAYQLEDVLSHVYKGVYVYQVRINGVHYYRVCVGKFISRDSADRIANRLAGEGYGVMVITYDN
jgi:rare lipoprotein A